MNKKVIIIFLIFYSFAANSSPDGPKEYTNPNQCLDDLVSILGPSYKLINKDTIVRDRKNNQLIIYYSNGKTVEVQPNGGCSLASNKADDFNGKLLGAMEKAKAKKHGALAVCEAQQSNSTWYKIFAGLGTKLEKPSGSKANK